jgi:hypothetical protein
MLTNAQLAKLTLETAILRRDQGLITTDQYRAFLYVWHADPTKTAHAPMARRPFGVSDALIDELLALTNIDENHKRDAWADADRAALVREQQAELARAERR